MAFMCPHCGIQFAHIRKDGLIPRHRLKPDLLLCPGSEQGPRNPDADRRNLWNGEKSPAQKAVEGGTR